MVTIPDSICSEIERIIIPKLDKIGLYYRIFSRIKTWESIHNKISAKGYSKGGRLLQDSIGVRVVVYFDDDITVCRNLFKDCFILDNEEFDLPQKSEFKPVRINQVYKIPRDIAHRYSLESLFHNDPIDLTFEAQIRTVFSEGWHEIEHDLRYKRISDWDGYDSYSRILNGIFATLTTCDWSILKLFDQLAYEYYLSQKWIPMIINHFRLKFVHDDTSAVSDILNSNPKLAKEIFKFSRYELILLFSNEFKYTPLTIRNCIYVINLVTIRDPEVLHSTPEVLLDKDANYSHVK